MGSQSKVGRAREEGGVRWVLRKLAAGTARRTLATPLQVSQPGAPHRFRPALSPDSPEQEPPSPPRRHWGGGGKAGDASPTLLPARLAVFACSSQVVTLPAPAELAPRHVRNGKEPVSYSARVSRDRRAALS